LLSIPERKPVSHHSLQKGIRNPSSLQSLTKKSPKSKISKKVESRKNIAHLSPAKKENKNKKTVKKSKPKKEKVREHSKKKNKTPM
jgi:hypothetical protein